MATQKELIRSEINVFHHFALILQDHIARSRGLYHTEEDIIAVKALIDTITMASRILTSAEIQRVLNIYVSGIAYIATAQTIGMHSVEEKLKEDRRVIEAFLRMRNEL